MYAKGQSRIKKGVSQQHKSINSELLNEIIDVLVTKPKLTKSSKSSKESLIKL